MPYTSQPYVSIGFTSVSNRSSMYSTDRVLCFSTCAVCACWHNNSKPPVKVFCLEKICLHPSARTQNFKLICGLKKVCNSS